MTSTEISVPDETAPDAVPELVAAAVEAGRVWAATGREDRADVLDAVADALDAAGDELVPLAMAESHLPEGRLRGELTRTTFQLRLFGQALRDGGYLDVRVDHADPDWPMGAPRPDLRRTQVPLGPVVVFAAVNFPFAFSVAGGDTASALAAGCPVLLKAHPGHLRLSVATAEVVRRALAASGAPDDLFTLLVGVEAGRAALTDPGVQAGAFTGSTTGGRTLFDLANGRPVPIPFFGELGSVNPVFVTRAAAEARGPEIAAQAVASFTLGAGQFCTKPGVLLVPEGSSVLEVLRTTDLPGPAPMLSERMVEGHARVRHELEDVPGTEVLVGGPDTADGTPAPTVLLTDVATLLADVEALFRECFGPTLLVATYAAEDDLLSLAQTIDGQLTATVFGEDSDVPHLAGLVTTLATKAGRLLWNAWPTGVSVTDAQQHGGPYPATTAPSTTSVGTAAISRFLRPVAFQGFPEGLLPAELTDGATLPRRVDGVLLTDTTR
nr:aldehyde dehydrogenase (NADP(+)) [Microlunatus antarcticus]